MEKELHLLLAEDDEDERFFFANALKELTVPTRLTTFQDGEKLMNYLYKKSEKLADVLFLDINMPLKNGFECLMEIKKNQDTNKLPVIIYTTSLNEKAADKLYEYEAYYYLQKTDFSDLIKYLQHILTPLSESRTERPERHQFIINLQGL